MPGGVPEARNARAPGSVYGVARTIRRANLSIGRPDRGGGRGETMAATGYERGEGWLFFAFVLLGAILGLDSERMFV